MQVWRETLLVCRLPNMVCLIELGMANIVATIWELALGWLCLVCHMSCITLNRTHTSQQNFKWFVCVLFVVPNTTTQEPALGWLCLVCHMWHITPKQLTQGKHISSGLFVSRLVCHMSHIRTKMASTSYSLLQTFPASSSSDGLVMMSWSWFSELWFSLVGPFDEHPLSTPQLHPQLHYLQFQWKFMTPSACQLRQWALVKLHECQKSWMIIVTHCHSHWSALMWIILHWVSFKCALITMNVKSFIFINLHDTCLSCAWW
jgi:hypothetical protein